MPISCLPITIAIGRASVDTSISLVVAKSSKRTKIIWTSIYTESSLIISIKIARFHINVRSYICYITLQSWTSIHTKPCTWVTKIILIFRTEGHAKVGTVISILTFNAVCRYCLAMRSTMNISPSSLFTKSNTNMLSNLRKPNNSTNNGTKLNTRTISSLISILIIRTLSYTLISAILTE